MTTDHLRQANPVSFVGLTSFMYGGGLGPPTLKLVPVDFPEEGMLTNQRARILPGSKPFRSSLL